MQLPLRTRRPVPSVPWRELRTPRRPRLYLVPAWASTQPALACYLGVDTGAPAAPADLFVLIMAGPKIHAVTRFHLDELYPRFGLPRLLPAGPGGPACAGT
jgi:hypothetical protein